MTLAEAIANHRRPAAAVRLGEPVRVVARAGGRFSARIDLTNAPEIWRICRRVPVVLSDGQRTTVLKSEIKRI